MEFDTATKEGKLLAAVVDVLEEMAKEVTNIDERCSPDQELLGLVNLSNT